MTRLTIGACTALGFTTGIDDEDLPPEALAEIERINSEARAKVDDELKQFGKDGRGYEARPGRTPIETMEENIMMILDEGKAATGDIAKTELTASSKDNAAVNMAISGARGSMDNLTMMAGSIGQAKVRGARLERGYKDRVLPHFPRGLKGAREKGFISSSFKRGLEPTEFFMLSISGRESLVDTAVRTSKSGYMQRRLINAMDDLKVFKDEKLSVRNTADRIIQFEYGEDGIDPCRSVHGMPVNTDVIIDKVLGTNSKPAKGGGK
jgi:DNA-directed RNA polymerase subunit A'